MKKTPFLLLTPLLLSCSLSFPIDIPAVFQVQPNPSVQPLRTYDRALIMQGVDQEKKGHSSQAIESFVRVLLLEGNSSRLVVPWMIASQVQNKQIFKAVLQRTITLLQQQMEHELLNSTQFLDKYLYQLELQILSDIRLDSVDLQPLRVPEPTLAQLGQFYQIQQEQKPQEAWDKLQGILLTYQDGQEPAAQQQFEKILQHRADDDIALLLVQAYSHELDFNFYTVASQLLPEPVEPFPGASATPLDTTKYDSLFEKARHLLAQYIKQNPQKTILYYSRIRLLLLGLKTFKTSPMAGTFWPQIQQDYQQLLTLEPTQANHYLLGTEIFKGRAQWPQALAAYDKILELKPEQAKLIYRERIPVYEELKDYHGAIADYNRLIALEGEDWSLFGLVYNRAMVYVQSNQLEQAIVSFTKLIQTDLKNTIFLLGRASAYEKQNRWDLAIQDYTKAIEIAPTHADFYTYRSNAYQKNNQLELAKQDQVTLCKMGKRCDSP